MAQDLRKQLLDFPPCDDRSFELAVGAFLNRHVEWTAWQRVEPDLLAFLEADVGAAAGAKELAEDVEKLRYASLYILAMRQRRLHQVDQFQRHMDSYESRMAGSPSEPAKRYLNCASYCHLKALLAAMKSGPDRLQEALDLAETAYKECGRHKCRHSGIVHHLASLRARQAEGEEPPGGFDQRELQEMLKLAQDAIDLEGEPYAKYFATRGRIKALLGDYKGAEEDVKLAICNEGDSWDYPLRYADYRAILAQIDLRRVRDELRRTQAILKEGKSSQAEMQAEFQRAQDEFNDSRMTQVELLGFFAGVLALILAGVQMAQPAGAGPRDGGAGAAMLILLTGCLLAAFGALGMLLHGRRFWIRPAAVAALGILVILAAVMFVLPSVPA